MPINSTSMTSALPSVDYVSLYRAQTQSQGASSDVPQELSSLWRPATVSLDAKSAAAASEAVQQVTRPSEVSLDAESLQQLSSYMSNKDSLDATNQVQNSNGLLMKLFGG